MKILAVMNEKGGSGKSTVSTNLATALHRSGLKVVLVDADPQGTARDWRSASPEDADLPLVVALDRPQMLSSVKTLSADFVVIDTPAKAEEMAAHVIRIADIALVVIQPSGADIWASAATVRMLKQKQDLGGSINAAFVVNRVSSQTKLSREIKGGEWNEYGFDQMEATIGNRISFAQALTDGLSVFDLQDESAKKEITEIINELKAAAWL